MRMTIDMRRGVVLMLCGLLATGCATTRTPGVVMAQTAEARVADSAVLADYVQRLPLGSPVRLDLTSGRTLRGTLVKTTERSMFVQPRTRIPEPVLEVAMGEIVRVTLDRQNGTNLGKAIGIGIAAGTGAVMGVMLILAAIFSD